MNWFYASNKKRLIFSFVISFCSVSYSHAMFQKVKSWFVKPKQEKELTIQEKVQHTVVSNLEQHTELAKKLKSYGKKIIVGGAVVGYCLGYALKPASSRNAALALSALLAGGQVAGVYDWSNVPVIKKIMERTGTTFTAGAIVAISFPVGWLICEHLPFASALIGGLLGYYVYKS